MRVFVDSLIQYLKETYQDGYHFSAELITPTPFLGNCRARLRVKLSNTVTLVITEANMNTLYQHWQNGDTSVWQELIQIWIEG